MLTADEYVNRYKKKLKSGGFKINNQPNSGQEIKRSYIDKSVDDFEKVLRSDLYNKVTG